MFPNKGKSIIFISAISAMALLFLDSNQTLGTPGGNQTLGTPGGNQTLGTPGGNQTSGGQHVTPEFPAGTDTFLILAGLFGSLIVIQRISSKNTNI